MRYWILLLLASAFGAQAQTPSADSRVWHCGPHGCTLSCSNTPRVSDLKQIKLDTLSNGSFAIYLSTWRDIDSFWLLDEELATCRLTGDLLQPSSWPNAVTKTAKKDTTSKAQEAPKWISKSCFGNRFCH